MSYAEADLRGPLAVVVGSEGRGMSGPVRRRLDLAVRIPMRGKIESLNAAVAGSILLFAAAQQRPVESAPDQPAAVESPAKPVRKPRTKKTSTAEEDLLPARGPQGLIDRSRVWCGSTSGWP